MHSYMYLVVTIFIILFFERLFFTSRLREPEGDVLDSILAKAAMGVYILICFLALGESLLVVNKNVFVIAIGVALTCLGIFLRRWAISTLGCNWSSYIRDIKNQQIVKTGPYKYFKHPYYIAVCMELLGIIIFCQAKLSIFIFIVVQLPLLFIRMKIEDRFHTKKFNRES